MDPAVTALVLTSAAIHPLREFWIKDDIYPEGLTFAVVKPKIFGPLIVLGISVVDSNFLCSSTVRISPDSCRPMIHVV